MAIIKCPECKKEDVSSYADVCPNCGFPIKDYNIKTKSEDNLKSNTTFYLNNYELAPMKFDNGLLDGVSGIHDFAGTPHNYRVVEEKIYIDIFGNEHLYIMTPDYILDCRSKLNGEIIDKNSLSGSFSHPTLFSSPEMGTDYYTFFPDGRYTDIRNKNSYSGLYLQHEDLVVVFVRDKPKCYIIHNNEIYEDAYIAPHRIEKVKELYKEIRELAETKLDSKVVKCPYCQSTNVKKISSLKRSASFSFLGFASSKVGKQWHCNSCNSDF